MQKKSRLKSIIKEKCPRCRQGDMFISPRYQLKKFDKMHNTCEVCGLKYDIEPGFYTGAMYISYAFTVAILVVSGFSLYFFFNDPDIVVYVFTTLTFIIILFPILFRYSRVIYLHLFGGVVHSYKENNSKSDVNG